MHNTTAPNGTSFGHNGDFSGNVRIFFDGPRTRDFVEVPFADILHLVARYLRDIKVSEAEDMTDEQLLGLTPRKAGE